MAKEYDVIIVGAGLSGLSAAFFLGRKCPQLRVALVDQAINPGGAIRTFRENGYQAEWGPHGFLNNVSESQEILEVTGLAREMQTAPLGDFRRFICHRGRLEALPQNPKMLLSTPLLSPVGKLRLLGDLWKRPRLEDQTIGEWAAYRFGREVLPMVDVAVTGTFAGDLNRLSIDAVMPGVRSLEKEAGSLLRGLRKKKKAGAGDALGLPAMVNFPGGMVRLIEALAKDQEMLLGHGVNEIVREGALWRLLTAQGELQAASLIMALPVNPALKLLAGLEQPPVGAIPGARIANVVMAFGGDAVIPRGFGYLAPESEHRFALGAMFSSHMFPDRCPEGQVLLEGLVGGRRHPERLELSDEELIARVYADLGQLLPLPSAPLYVKVLRPEGEIPQLEMDHPALSHWRRQMEERWDGLYICGFGWDGIGINDMAKTAARTAEALAAGQGRSRGSAAVRPVYF
ncbi:MAG: protoporphyrinogen oxidase [Desulfobulbaceae bacterium]|nr:protoporphyrinogen oxidase [Desulfobulbaceae bacterium]